MASSTISFLATCILLFAVGHHAAITGGQGLAREGELPWEASTEDTSPARRTGVKGASTEPVLARRDLAARLGGAGKGSSPAKGTVKGAVHPADAAALLKSAALWKKAEPTTENLDGTVDTRGLLETWDVRRPCSEWFGVTCNSATHRVTAIKLPGLGDKESPVFLLDGPFPEELGALRDLRTLILARNSLRGVPDSWAGLAKLSHLDLSDNYADAGHDFDLPPTTVSPALCKLTGLTYLNVANTPFVALPKEFTSLKKFAWVDLSFSYIPLGTGDFNTLKSLSGLRSLLIRRTFEDIATISGLSKLHGLRLLDLSETPVKASFWKNVPAFLKGLTALEDLRMRQMWDGNGLFEDVRLPMPSWLGRLGQLTSLDLSYNGFTGSLPTKLGAKLAKLVLSDNSLTGSVPSAISNSRSLVHVNLARNKLSLAGITFGPHASSRLKRLDLSKNNLKGTIPKGLSSLTGLDTLTLSNNLLSGALPPFIWTKPTLTKLVLSHNNLTGFGLTSQQIRAGRLKRLDFSYNKLKGPLPKGLSALKSLSALVLKKNQITGGIPAWLGTLRGLVFLDLSFNQLTGKIPRSLLRANLTLVVDHNRLSGK